MTQPAATEDDLLVRRFVDGDPTAFDHIVLRYQQRIMNLAYRLLGWSDEAEDVVQDVFLSAYKNLSSFQSRASLNSWLAAITVNKCRTWRRKRLLRWKIHFAAQLGANDCVDEKNGRTIDSDTMAQLHRTILKLPAKFREVIVLRYLEQMPIAEIASILKVAENTVHVRLNRARGRLKEKLANVFED